MIFNNILYRVVQKLKYHFSTDTTLKRIAEINRHNKRIIENKKSYKVIEIDLEIPKEKFDYIFEEKAFELLLSNFHALKSKYRILNNMLICEFDTFKFHILSKSELYIINEIFVEQCYKFCLPEGEAICVIDLGMNVGIASLYFANIRNVEKVYSFEPFTPTFNSAIFNLNLNQKLSKKINPFDFGLGIKDDVLYVEYNKLNTGINSSLKKNYHSDNPNVQKIIIKNASDIVTSIINKNRGMRFIIKVDTEGSEYDILKSISKNLLHKSIVGIMLEWHFKGSLKLEEQLVNCGFHLISTNINKNSGLIYGFK